MELNKAIALVQIVSLSFGTYTFTVPSMAIQAKYHSKNQQRPKLLPSDNLIDHQPDIHVFKICGPMLLSYSLGLCITYLGGQLAQIIPKKAP
jgi:hypothetical protein